MVDRKREVYLPSEIDSWFARGLITKEQRDMIRRGYQTDLNTAVDHYYQLGILEPDQVIELKMRFIPDEIEQWYKEGLINERQYQTMLSSYVTDLGSAFRVYREYDLMDHDQIMEIYRSYDSDVIPKIEDGMETIEDPAPFLDYETTDRPKPIADTDESTIDKELLILDRMRESESLMEFPSEEESERPQRSKKISTKPPEKISTKSQEKISTRPPERIKTTRAKKLKTKPPEKGDRLETKPAEVPKEKMSPYDFMQLVFYLGGTTILFVGIFFLIAWAWNSLPNDYRGWVFMVVALLGFIDGLMVKSFKSVKHLDTALFNFSFLVFCIGIIFLFVGYADRNLAEHMVTIISIAIPTTIMYVGVYKRYISISILATLAAVTAMIWGMIAWAPGAVISIMGFFVVSYLYYYLAQKNVEVGLQKHPMTKILKDLNKLTRFDSIFARCFLSLGFNFLLIAINIAQVQNSPQNWFIYLLMAPAIGVPIFITIAGSKFKLPELVFPAFLWLTINIITQTILHLDLVIGRAAWLLLITYFLGFIYSSYFFNFKGKLLDKIIYGYIGSLSAFGLMITPFILSELHPVVDYYSQFTFLFLLIGLITYVYSISFKKRISAVISLIIFIFGVINGTFFKFDGFVFLIFLVPILLKRLDPEKKYENYIVNVPITLISVLFLILWLGPNEPAFGMERLGNWMTLIKASVMILFGYITFIWSSKLRKIPGFVVGNIIFYVGVILIAYNFGEYFHFLIFAIPLTLWVLKSKKEDNFSQAVVFYRFIFLMVAGLSFLLMWFDPQYPLFTIGSFGWFYWKFLLTIIFAFLFVLWGLLIDRFDYFLVGNVFYCASLFFLAVSKCDLFLFGVFLLPMLVYLFKMVRGKRAKDFMLLRNTQIYFIYFLIPAIVAYFLLWIIPLDPLFDIYDLGTNIYWYKGLITLAFSVIILVWASVERFQVHYPVGVGLFVISAMVITFTKLDAFAFVLFLLPVHLWILENRFGKKWKSLLDEVDKFYIEFNDSNFVQKRTPNLKGLFSYYDQIFLVLYLIGYTIMWAGPLYGSFRFQGEEAIYWQFFVTMVFSLIILFTGIFRSKPGYILFANAYYVISLLYLAYFKSSYLPFLVLLLPIFIWVFRGFELKKEPAPVTKLIHKIIKQTFTNRIPLFLHTERPKKKLKNEKKPHILTFAKVYCHLFLLTALVAFISMWVPAKDPWFQFGNDLDIWIKMISLLVFSYVLYFWGLVKYRPGHYFVGSFFAGVVILVAALDRGEALAFLVFVPLLGIFISSKVRKTPEWVNSFHRIFDNYYLVILFACYFLLFFQPSKPLIDAYGILGRNVYFMKSALLFTYSGIILYQGLDVDRKLTYVLGVILYVISTIYITLIYGEIFLLLLFIVPAIPVAAQHFKKDHVDTGFFRKINIYYVITFSLGFLLLWNEILYPILNVERIGVELIWLKFLVGTALSTPIIIMGKKRNMMGHMIMGSLGLFITALVISSIKLDILVFLIFLPLILIRFLTPDMGLPTQKHIEKFEEVFVYSFLLTASIGFLILLITTIPERAVFEYTETLGLFIFLVKGVMALTFSSIFLVWGVIFKKSSYFIFGSVLFCITSIYLTAYYGEFAILLILIVPLVPRIVKMFRDVDVDSNFHTNFSTFYLVGILICHFFIWFPIIHPLLDLEALNIDLIWPKGAAGLILGLILVNWGLKEQKYWHFITGHVIYLLFVLSLTITKDGSFVYLIFVLPFLIIVYEKMKHLDVLTNTFRKPLLNIENSLPDGMKVKMAPESFFQIYSPVFVGIALFCFCVLFIMVWAGPIRPIFDGLGDNIIWTKCLYILVLGSIFIVWGLRKGYRFHILAGVFMVVVDSWVLGILKGSTVGAGIASIITAFCLIFTGLYVARISVKKKEMESRSNLTEPSRRRKDR